ncbi:MAG: hypothetical protein IJ620_06335, partial [Bacteroidales bacterium]|nr:hypothetical protein [Bacteroidales bacterium]
MISLLRIVSSFLPLLLTGWMSFFVLLVSAHAQNDYTTTLREPPLLENEIPSILVSTIDANTVERIDTDFIMPPFLRQGDSVALIAPSY